MGEPGGLKIRSLRVEGGWVAVIEGDPEPDNDRISRSEFEAIGRLVFNDRARFGIEDIAYGGDLRPTGSRPDRETFAGGLFGPARQCSSSPGSDVVVDESRASPGDVIDQREQRD